jgi:hypothetical protein
MTAQDARATTVPAGTQLDVLLQTEIKASARAGFRFDGSTVSPYPAAGPPLLSTGSKLSGFVSSVRARRGQNPSQMTLSFEEISIDAVRNARMRATVVAVLDPKRPSSLPANDVGPVTGTSPGLPPFTKVVVSAEGAIVSRDVSDVALPVGIVLRIRLDQPIQIPSR